MKNKKTMIFLITNLFIVSLVGISAYGNNIENEKELTNTPFSLTTNGYGIQWEMNYGNDRREGARYEGPQPIGDCDGDGDNELLISGRDAAIRVMEWIFKYG